MVFDKLKKAILPKNEATEEDYLEIDLEKEQKESKIFVKLFVLNHYDDVNDILNAIREGFAIAVIDIKPLRQKDSIELKRAVSKIKKTADALEGNIAGFGENLVIVTPSFATIHKQAAKPKDDKRTRLFD